MTISQRLEARQTQRLVMTPQLQQAIKLLQMSNIELAEFVNGEIEQNPLLEKADFSGGDTPQETQDNAEPETLLAEAALGEVWADEDFHDNENYSGKGGGFDSDDDYSRALNVASGKSLREYLIEQIQIDFIDPAEKFVALALMEVLDEAGYLPADLSSVRAQLGADEGLFERTIIKLQHLDPPGIFARSLHECLAIQLYEKNRLDEAMQKMLQHLDLVAKKEKSALMRLCGVDEEDLAEMFAEIRELNPKPALSFAADVAHPVTPDVLLRPRHGGGWLVELNGENLPRVLANERYYALVQGSVRSKNDKEYLSERWQQANWLVKALHQRANTILKVASEIAAKQGDFFLHGVQHLKPLALKDIAEAVEMHESTVSRVTQNKFIATPRGTFELKYFFSTGIATIAGKENVSSTAVKERIHSLISSEKPDSVFSDDDLAIILKSEGIHIARRTVAKYREILKIPTSSQRKRDKRA